MAVTFRIKPGNEPPVTVTRPDSLRQASVFLRDKLQDVPDGGIIELEADEPAITPATVSYVLTYLRDGFADPHGRGYDAQSLAEVCNLLVEWQCDPTPFQGLWDRLTMTERSEPDPDTPSVRCWDRRMKEWKLKKAKRLAISALVLGKQEALERELGLVVWLSDDQLETTVPGLQDLEAKRAEERQHIYHDIHQQVFAIPYANPNDQSTRLVNDIVQRVRRNGKLGQLTDTWEDNCAAHPELRTYNPYKLIRRFEEAIKPPESIPPAMAPPPPPAANGQYQPPGSKSFPIDIRGLAQIVGERMSNVVRRPGSADNSLAMIEGIFDAVETRLKARQRKLAEDLILRRNEMVAIWSREIKVPGSSHRPSPKGKEQQLGSLPPQPPPPPPPPPPPGTNGLSGYRGELGNGEGSSRQGPSSQRVPPPRGTDGSNGYRRELHNGEGSSRQGVSSQRVPPPPSFGNGFLRAQVGESQGTGGEQPRPAELSSVSTRRKPVNVPPPPERSARAGKEKAAEQENGGGGANVFRGLEQIHAQVNFGDGEDSWRHGDDARWL